MNRIWAGLLLCVSLAMPALCFYFGIRLMRGDYSDWKQTTCKIENATQIDECFTFNDTAKCVNCYYTVSLYWRGKIYKKDETSSSCPPSSECSFNIENILDSLVLGEITDDNRSMQLFGGIILFLLALCFVPCIPFSLFTLCKSCRKPSLFPKDTART